MKTVLAIIAASLLAFSVPAYARMCCKKCCHVGESRAIPVETGKGSCKAHPGSCK